MFFFYQLITFFIIILSPIIIIIRIIKHKEDKSRFWEKFSLNSKKRKKGKLIWFHGSSVGELMSILPLVHYYENSKEIDQILITSSTLSSSNIIKKYKFKKTIHQFFPIDFFFISKKFLNYWKPSVGVFVESEIWPCIFRILNNKKIPLVLLNARITNSSFKRWLYIKSYAKIVFKNINFSYPQNLETVSYLKKLNVKKIKFIGNLKFIENPYDKILNFKKKLNVKFLNHILLLLKDFVHHDWLMIRLRKQF